MPKPDWTFQDTAVRKCLAALDRTSGNKVGLIIPTGGGKTRVALRIALQVLNRDPKGPSQVVWVTHRKTLRQQAHQDLQMMINQGVHGLPDRAATLPDRIEFIMLSAIEDYVADPDALPALIIIDEAHHAAAASYDPIFNAGRPLAVLALTATPNRTDGLPIRISEIAFAITFTELAERGVILRPEFRDFPVKDFTWTAEEVADLSKAIIEGSRSEYTKVLVIAPRIDRVEEFHRALVHALTEDPGHILKADDLGYVHSQGTSHGVPAEDLLRAFKEKPRAILVSAQMLLEGFNDPAINTVVITYPSQSVLLLMQAAGRGVRSNPGKTNAYVVQARNDEIAYHFEERWLYQEISDYLRPQLLEISYRDTTDLVARVEELMAAHRVDASDQQKVLAQVRDLSSGELCRILLSGTPYFGSADDFDAQAQWSTVLETSKNSEAFRFIFNEFCNVQTEVTEPEQFLHTVGHQFGLVRDPATDSDWSDYVTMYLSMQKARREIYDTGSSDPGGASRLLQGQQSSTWLKYVTFSYEPTVPPELEQFLADCHNREELISSYSRDPARYALAAKVPVPLGDNEAFLLEAPGAAELAEFLKNARSSLVAIPPGNRYRELSGMIYGSHISTVPVSLLARVGSILDEEAFQANSLDLSQSDQTK